eukprot:scaffold221978_cov33-Tisochrysis_lutea.AAC.4
MLPDLWPRLARPQLLLSSQHVLPPPELPCGEACGRLCHGMRQGEPAANPCRSRRTGARNRIADRHR